MKQLILLAVFSATGIFSHNDVQAMQSPFPNQMRGIWQTTCHRDGDYYRLTEIEIHEDVWVTTDWYATDKYCSNIALEKQSTFQVSLNAEHWNGKSLMTYIRPYLQNLANKFNSDNLCGHQNWKHGRIIEVTGQTCKDFQVPGYDQIIYSIYKTEGPRDNILYIGAPTGTNDGLSEQTRHREFSPLILIRDPGSF